MPSVLPRLNPIFYEVIKGGILMKRSILALVALTGTTAVLMMLIASHPAFAQEASPCAEDIKQYCGHVTPGGGRLIRCYEERKDSMSGACRAWAEGAKANASVLSKACSQMIDARCNTEKGDPLATLDCLQGHYVDLTSECRVKLTDFKRMYPKPVK
jgi:hypothetical protein